MGRSRSAPAASAKPSAEDRLLQIQSLETALRSRNQIIIEQGVAIERLGGPVVDWKKRAHQFEVDLGLESNDVASLQIKNVLLAREAEMNAEQLRADIVRQREDYEERLRLSALAATNEANQLRARILHLERDLKATKETLAETSAREDRACAIARERSAKIEKLEASGVAHYVKENGKLRRRLHALRAELNGMRAAKGEAPLPEEQEFGSFHVGLKQ